VTLTGIDWPLLLLWFAIGIGVTLVLFARYIFSVFDPWAYALVLNQSIVIGVMGYFWRTGDLAGSHFAYILLCIAALGLGMALFYDRRPPRQGQFPSLLSQDGLAVATVVLIALLVVNNLIIYALAGIPALREGARTITLYSELGSGFGLLAYVNQALFLVLPVLALRCLLLDDRPGLGISALIVVALGLIGAGGKSGLLGLLFAYALAIYWIHQQGGKRFHLPRALYVTAAITVLLSLFTFRNVVQSGYEATVPLAFARRLFEAAGGPYYYFIQSSYEGFSGLNLLAYHFTHVAPYFGLADPRAIDLGVNLTLLSRLHFGSPGFGPNPYYIVVGHIWGGLAGLTYAFVLGAFLSLIRYRLRAGFTTWMILNTVVATLVSDGTLFSLYLFYVIIFCGPPVILAILATDAARGMQRARLAPSY
jgi:hypothetical protein